MEQAVTLLLPVDDNGKELEFEMRSRTGYVPGVGFISKGIPVIFENDNDGRYRFLVSPERMHHSKHLATGLFNE